MPLPTISKHIRARGFDHISLVCRKTGLDMERLLVRQNNSVQVGADAEARVRQAGEAYRALAVESDKKYLLVDDVWTTGSSICAACNEMRKMGAKNLSIAVIAKSV